MTGQDPLQWPMVQLVCSRLKEEDEGKIYYCALLLACITGTLKPCAEQAWEDAKRLED